MYDLNLLIKKVQEKKELKNLNKIVIEELALSIIKKSNIKLELLREKEVKTLVKLIRKELRNYVGRFHSSDNKREFFLDKGDFSSLLLTHSSTKERIDFYPKLKEKLEELKIKSILDLGCGLNPLALANKKIKYYASDITQGDLDIISNYFNQEGIKGETFFFDLRNLTKPLPEADITLILKVFDVIEKKGHKLAEKILLHLKSKYVLVSFSTKTLSGKPMNHPQRGWIEQLLKRINYEYSIFNSQNEIFYLISTNSKTI